MSNAALPQVYLDLIGEVTDSDVSGQAILVYNRVPEPNETDVPLTAPIELYWADVATVGITVAEITVESQSGSVIAATVNGTTPTFGAGYSGSVYSASTSVGGSGTNEHRLQLIRSTPWASEERVNVKVRIVPVSGATYNQTYWFFTEDTTAPKLQKVETQGLDTLIVTFNEPMLMSADDFGALNIRDVTGRLTFTEPSTVEIEHGNLNANDVGRFLCFAGSERAQNNDYFSIQTVTVGTISRATVQPQTIRTEAPQLAHVGFVGPYKLSPIMEQNGKIPTFTPCIVGAEAVDSRTVRLFLDQELSPGRPYTLYASQVSDAADPGNVALSTSVAFVAENLPVKEGRKFSLWDSIPAANKREDSSGDLERFIRCFDEVAQLLLKDTDDFERINDIDTTPPEFIDVLLQHLGNPYTFVQTDLQKRRVADSLVKTYQNSGLERSIEDAVFKILGITINVFPFNLPDVGWIMGESEIGVDSILGSNDPFLKYSFEIVVFEHQDVVLTGTTSTIIRLQVGGLKADQFVGRTLRIGNEDRTILSNTANTVTVDRAYTDVPPTLSAATILGVLTETERSTITEIAKVWKPAHTHFVRFIESGTAVPTY